MIFGPIWSANTYVLFFASSGKSVGSDLEIFGPNDESDIQYGHENMWYLSQDWQILLLHSQKRVMVMTVTIWP